MTECTTIKQSQRGCMRPVSYQSDASSEREVIIQWHSRGPDSNVKRSNSGGHATPREPILDDHLFLEFSTIQQLDAMTLRYYQSTNMPVVDFSNDGRVSYTKPDQQSMTLDPKNLQREAGSNDSIGYGSLTSYDTANGRRYQKNAKKGSFKSTSSGSLLTRNFGEWNWLNSGGNGKNGSENGDSVDDLSRGKTSSFLSSESKIARKKLKEMEKQADNPADKSPLVEETDTNVRHLLTTQKPTTKRPPGVSLIFLGLLFLAAAIVNLLFAPWHEYYCCLWTGVLVLVHGAVGVAHRGVYFFRCRNWFYIVLGFLSAAAATTSTFLVLLVLVPLLHETGIQATMDHNVTLAHVINIPFTNTKSTLLSLGDATLHFWLVLGALVACFVFVLLCHYCLAAAIMVFSNFWDAEYKTTGLCNHHQPRLFNPTELMKAGQATAIFGMCCIVLSLHLTPTRSLYWSPLVAAILVIIAGFFALCAGKRPDVTALGALSVFVQLLALAAIAISTALLALGFVKDISKVGELLEGKNDISLWYRVTNLGAFGAFVVSALIDAVFIIGMLVLYFRRICSMDSKA